MRGNKQQYQQKQIKGNEFTIAAKLARIEEFDNNLPFCGQKAINVQIQQLWTGVHKERDDAYISGNLDHL